ncbi:MAG TPA: dihydropteroate synthase [Candidatus Acidoferrales bacterium]|nr:dihydropteroate synthase [Candidatus Acidoferrales bacterium]
MNRRKKFRLHLPSHTILLGERTLIMGVLNVTPDSFSDGGKFIKPEAAVERALEMEHDGADVLDIGGESTRPGASPLGAAEELERILPVLEMLRGKLKIPISIDTQKAEVAKAAISRGAVIVNNVSALQLDKGLADVVTKHKVGIILMHMRGKPRTMQNGPFARDVMRDVIKGLREALGRAKQAGIERSRILIDPGIGFGKNYRQNFEVLARLSELSKLGCPIVLGASRKAFLGASLDNAAPEKRTWGTAATVAAAILGGAHIVRVHDVKEMAQVARITDRVADARK